MSTPLPRSRGSFARFIVDHNPFYLLSAALMLLACLLLGNTMTWSPIGVDRIVMLIAVLNVYELLLVGLGLYLITRRGLVRDGVMLLVFEAFFVVDVGFLNSEVYQQNQLAGQIVNAMLLLLIAGKIWLIFRVLGLRLVSARFVVTMAEIGVLLFLPGVLKHLSLAHHGVLHGPALYVCWWLIAGLMAAAAIVTRYGPSEVTTRPYAAAARGIANFFLVLPLVSLVAHLGTTHWVFAVPFHAIDLSPVLLGTAMLLMGVPTIARQGRSEQRMLCGMLIAAAALCVVNPGYRILFPLGPLAVSSTTLTLAAAYLVAVYCFAITWARILVPLGTAAGTAYLVGPSRETILHDLDWTLTALVDGAVGLMPKTQRQWGGVAMAGSFVLLIVGAWISLTRGPAAVQPHDAPAPAPGTPDDSAPTPCA